MTLFIYLIILTVFLLFVFMFMWSTYNSFVRQKYRVMNEYSNIDVQLKRRSSLLQNLADVVKAYAKHEKETFTEVAQARAAVETSKNATDFAQADTMVNQSALSLFGVVERYPDLKASENYQNLQREFQRTEDTIAVYREEYNKAVLQFNTIIHTFPNVLVATVFNFQSAYFFQANQGNDSKVSI